MLICWISFPAFSQGRTISEDLKDTIAFYNAKYNTTLLVPLKIYQEELSRIKDDSMANECNMHILSISKDRKHKGDYIYLAPKYHVKISSYDHYKHYEDLEHVMNRVIRSKRFKILLNGKVYRMKDLEMDTAPTYATLNRRRRRTGKQWLLKTKEDNKIVWGGLKRIKKKKLNSYRYF